MPGRLGCTERRYAVDRLRAHELSFLCLPLWRNARQRRRIRRRPSLTSRMVRLRKSSVFQPCSGIRWLPNRPCAIWSVAISFLPFHPVRAARVSADAASKLAKQEEASRAADAQAQATIDARLAHEARNSHRAADRGRRKPTQGKLAQPKAMLRSPERHDRMPSIRRASMLPGRLAKSSWQLLGATQLAART